MGWGFVISIAADSQAGLPLGGGEMHDGIVDSYFPTPSASAFFGAFLVVHNGGGCFLAGQVQQGIIAAQEQACGK